MRRLLLTGLALSLAIHLGGLVLFAEDANLVEMEAAKGGAVSVIGALEDMVEGSQENIEAVEPETEPETPVEEAEPVEAVETPVTPPVETAQPVEPLEQTGVAAIDPDVIPLEEPAQQAEPVEREDARPVERQQESEAVEPQAVEETEVQPAEQVETPVPVPVRRPDYTPPVETVEKAGPREVPKQQPVPEKPKKQARKKPPAKAQNKGAETAQRRGGQQVTSQSGRSNNVGKAQGRSAIGGKAARDNYNGMVLRRLQRAKRYPSEARRNRLRGVAVVSFTVSRSGSVSGVRLARSSGHRILDQEAIAMVSRASPMPPIPQSVADNRITFHAPVNFTR